MMLLPIVLVFLGLILIGSAFMAVNIYNGLISLSRQVERAWANIDVILKQRFDEIPQIIQVIEQFASYEVGILKNLSEARTNYGQARNVKDKIGASQTLSLAMQGIMAIGEAYPDLKANQNFTQLQNRISQLENSIADRREVYNEAVTNFNTRIDQFPDMIAARILNYKQQDLFKTVDSEKAAPSLKLNMPKFGT